MSLTLTTKKYDQLLLEFLKSITLDTVKDFGYLLISEENLMQREATSTLRKRFEDFINKKQEVHTND